VLQLLDLARENAALKRELCRIHAEAEALQRLVAAIYAGENHARPSGSMRCCGTCRTPSGKDEPNDPS